MMPPPRNLNHRASRFEPLTSGGGLLSRPAKWLKISAIFVALSLWFGVIVAQASAKTVVIHSTGPSAQEFRTGRILDLSKEILLKAGDKLTLLDENGTRVFVGPAKVRLQMETERRGLTWEDIVGAGPRRATGGVRSVLIATESHEKILRPATLRDAIWDIDPNAEGNWCFAEAATLRFWRQNRAKESKLYIESGSKHKMVNWPAGSGTINWPKGVPVTAQKQYTIFLPNHPKRIISLQKVAPALNMLELEQALADKGCYQQLSVLVES